jgi:hypothetical protein
VTPSLSERADAPAAAGASDFNALLADLRVSQVLGVSPAYGLYATSRQLGSGESSISSKLRSGWA